MEPETSSTTEFCLVVSSDVYMLPLTNLSVIAIELFTPEMILFIETLPYVITNPYPDLQGLGYYYPCFTGEDIGSQEGRHLLKTGSGFKAKCKAWLHPSSHVAIALFIPVRNARLPAISSHVILPSWPSTFSSLRPSCGYTIDLFPLLLGFFHLSTAFLSLATFWLCGLEEVI